VPSLGPATHYQVDLTGAPDQVYLSGLPESEWLVFECVRIAPYALQLIETVNTENRDLPRMSVTEAFWANWTLPL
jgi:hypothetical protein